MAGEGLCCTRDDPGRIYAEQSDRKKEEGKNQGPALTQGALSAKTYF